MMDNRNNRDRLHSLNEFYRKIGEQTRLEPHQLVPITHYILGSLVRRLHYTGAARLTSLLPQSLGEELLDMPAGPDRTITVGSMLEGLIRHHGLSEPAARATIFNFFATLEEMLPPDLVTELKSQLPEEFQALFIGSTRAPRETGHVA